MIEAWRFGDLGLVYRGLALVLHTDKRTGTVVLDGKGICTAIS
jgi:hypothetical protein